MKKIIILMSLIFASNLMFAQIAFKTGSVGFDTDLNNINVRAKVDFGKFKVQLSTNNRKATPKKIDYMRKTVKMQPAEIYLAFEIARIAGVSIDIVIGSYKKNKHKGWGHIAKQMGIKPGSSEFHALKGKAKNKAYKGKGKGNKGNKGSKGNKGNKGNKGGKGKKK